MGKIGTVIQEAYIQGTSTRSVDDLVRAMTCPAGDCLQSPRTACPASPRARFHGFAKKRSDGAKGFEVLHLTNQEMSPQKETLLTLHGTFQ
ncbi:MAG: hypothetical protein Q8S27_03740 [Hoeflea sp.]|nr:hypothetical protein [Hoeflea sp.]